jgi:hypothetical protein
MDLKKNYSCFMIGLIILGFCAYPAGACESDEQEEYKIKDQDLTSSENSEYNCSSACQQSNDLLYESWIGAFLSFLEKLFSRYPVIKELLIMIFS